MNNCYYFFRINIVKWLKVQPDVDLTDMIEDMVDESMDTLEDVDMNDTNAIAEVLEESVNIDDLLESDDEELF